MSKLYENLAKIDGIMARINTHPEYSACLTRDEYHALRIEAEKHSLEMELQGDFDFPVSRAGDIIHERDKHKAKAVKRLSGAMDYLGKNGINLSTISALGFMIAPKSNRNSGFRNELVAYGSFYGEEPGKIIYKVKNLVDSLQDQSSHPVVRASNAHLTLIQIHPYMDGNGRTARLVQNQLLLERGYPPAIIHSDNKPEYLKIIGEAIKDRIGGNSDAHNQSGNEKLFHDFIAEKVLYSAESVENLLKSRKMYDVVLAGVSNFGAVRTLAEALRSEGRFEDDKGVSVSVDRKNGGKKQSMLKITGNLNREKLKNVLDRFSKKCGFRYSIEVNPKRAC